MSDVMSGVMVSVTFLLAFGVLGATAWGWTVLPAEARFPISFGVPPSVEGTIGKRGGLILFLLIQLWLFVLSLFAATEGQALGWIGVGLMAFFLTIEIRLLRRLAR